MRVGAGKPLPINKLVRECRRMKAEPEKRRPLKVAYLGNCTMDLQIVAFEHACLKNGLSPRVRVHGGEDLLQVLLDAPDHLLDDDLDLVVLSLRPEVMGFDAFEDPEGRSKSRELEQRVLRNVASCIAGIRKRTSASILIHGFEAPALAVAGIRDAWNTSGSVSRVRRLNASVKKLAAPGTGVYLLDLDLIQSRMGANRFLDRRSWHLWRSPHTFEGVQAIAEESMRLVRALKGMARKCLALDCDNTLWGGILGEAGPEGILLGGDYPGNAYREFQRAILGLRETGVLLAICSKNNEQDVLQVLDKHPEMVLRPDHFSAMRINWRDKADNLRELSRELNLGLDSFVFVDDSEFEVGLVDALLPRVATLHLSGGPEGYAEALLAPGLFDVLEQTAEDRERSTMYRADRLRQQAMDHHVTIQDYYRELAMEAELMNADEVTSARIAQLSQRSNQFNLTTVRYGHTEIRSLAARDDVAVRALRLRDRYGDLGIVGVSVLDFSNDVCRIRSLLMSCRALGREVEQVLLADCETMALNRGCSWIQGCFVPSKRNEQVRDFFDRSGFVLHEEMPEGSRIYGKDLGAQGAAVPVPEHIHVHAPDWPGGGTAADSKDINKG